MLLELRVILIKQLKPPLMTGKKQITMKHSFLVGLNLFEILQICMVCLEHHLYN